MSNSTYADVQGGRSTVVEELFCKRRKSQGGRGGFGDLFSCSTVAPRSGCYDCRTWYLQPARVDLQEGEGFMSGCEHAPANDWRAEKEKKVLCPLRRRPLIKKKIPDLFSRPRNPGNSPHPRKLVAAPVRTRRGDTPNNLRKNLETRRRCPSNTPQVPSKRASGNHPKPSCGCPSNELFR